MAQDAAQKLMGQMVDQDTLEPVGEHSGCIVEFYMEAEQDPLLTDGGEIEKRHPKVKEIRKLEQETLEMLRKQDPFPEEEPQAPKNQQDPVAMRKYADAHEDWDRRRKGHDADLVEQATLLRDHGEHKDVFVVSPAGRPIFVDREYIRKIVPGDKDNIVQRPVRNEDREHYRIQYTRFKEGLSQASVGTPLEQWPGVTKAQAKQLRYYEIHTVEQLASVSDEALSKLGPLMAIRNKAQDWVKTSRGMKPVEEARAETKRAMEQIEELKRQVADLVKAQQGNQTQQQRR
jgi:hypothetical protein